jgi:2-hydroxychromene-2-carboxylate isomerase
MTHTIDFYFDFRSPYAYLAHTQLPRIAAEHHVTIAYHPFRILELMRLVGNTPTTVECKPKNIYAGADLRRWSKRYDVGFVPNPHVKSFNFGELSQGALIAIEDGRGTEYVSAIFNAYWAGQADLSQRSVLIGVLNSAGFDAQGLLDRANTEDMAAKLDAATQTAARRGVFGAPTVFVGDEMFFGNDRLDFVTEAVRNTP